MTGCMPGGAGGQDDLAGAPGTKCAIPIASLLWPRSIVVSMFVCVSVCRRGYLRNQIFVHVAHVRGSVPLQHVDDRPHRLSAGWGEGNAQHSAGEV